MKLDVDDPLSGAGDLASLAKARKQKERHVKLTILSQALYYDKLLLNGIENLDFKASAILHFPGIRVLPPDSISRKPRGEFSV